MIESQQAEAGAEEKRQSAEQARFTKSMQMHGNLSGDCFPDLH
jgi:hypothetical protein